MAYRYSAFRLNVSQIYTRISKSGGRSYLQLVEGHRDAEGKVRIKVVANLGRMDRLSPDKLDPLINGLNRAVGRLENTACEIKHDPARTYGTVFALHELRKDLGFDRARLCCANRVRDSLFESSMIAGGHEQLAPYEVQDHELVGLQ